MAVVPCVVAFAWPALLTAILRMKVYHSETAPGENQNLFARLTVRTYVWIVPDWTLQQSMAKSTERRVRDVSYVGEAQSLPWYATCCT